MKITRRSYAKLCAALGVGGAATPRLSLGVKAVATLKEAAAAKHIRYGALADINLNESTAYREIFQSQCALCAVDIWAPAFSLSPNSLNFINPENATIIAAVDSGLPITGAHLLWYYHMPTWFRDISGQTEAANAIVEYAYGIANHHRGKAWSWNVVNESLNPRDGQPLGLRRCWPLQLVGPGYIDMTFRAARRADPAAVLVYNDSDMELDTPEQEGRRRALLMLLDDLLRRKTPVDAIGLQSHLKYSSFSQFNDIHYRTFLSEVAARGVSIVITELDVLDVGSPSDIGMRDRAVAEIYGRFLSTALDEMAVKAVVTWGLSNRYSWLNQKDDQAFVRKDGLSERPLPFDDDLKHTPAFEAIVKAFSNAPQR